MGAKMIMSSKINTTQFIELYCKDKIDVDNETHELYYLVNLGPTFIMFTLTDLKD